MSVSLFCDHITVLDIAYFDKNKGLVGDSYHVNVEFLGSPNGEGILIDFSQAKKQVKGLIDEVCDHRFVLPAGLAQAKEDRFYLEYSFGSSPNSLFYEGPLQAICEIPFSYVSKEHIASFLESKLIEYFGSKFEQIKITLEDENLFDQPILNYTHGLKQHYGNCQRLFHGHKNSIDIWVNEEKRADLESWIVRDHLKANIHFCIAENVKNLEEVYPHLNGLNYGIPKDLSLIEIEYTSSQGHFRAQLPGDMVYILPIESTVENLSTHLAEIIKTKLNTKDKVKLKAYEGISKGAISYL